MEKHIHELQFVEKGGVQCAVLGCGVYYSEEEIIKILEVISNKEKPICPECGAESEENHYRECSRNPYNTAH